MTAKLKNESNKKNWPAIHRLLVIAALLILIVNVHAQAESSIETTAKALGIEIYGSKQDITVPILALAEGQALLLKSDDKYFAILKTSHTNIDIFDLDKMDKGFVYGSLLDCGDEPFAPNYIGRNQGFVIDASGFDFLKFACYDSTTKEPKYIDGGRGSIYNQSFLDPKEKIKQETSKEFGLKENTADAFRQLLFRGNEIPIGESNLKKALEWAGSKWEANTKPDYPVLYFSTFQNDRYKQKKLFMLQLNKNKTNGDVTAKVYIVLENWPSITWDLAGTVQFSSIEFITKDSVIEKLRNYAFQSPHIPTEAGKAAQSMDAIADELETNRTEFYDVFNVPPFKILVGNGEGYPTALDGDTIIISDQHQFPILITGIKYPNSNNHSVILKLKGQKDFDPVNDWYQIGSVISTAASNGGTAEVISKERKLVSTRCDQMDRHLNYYSCYLTIDSVNSKGTSALDPKELPIDVAYYDYYSLDGSSKAIHHFNISFPCAATSEPAPAPTPSSPTPTPPTPTPSTTIVLPTSPIPAPTPIPASCPTPAKSMDEIKAKTAQKFYKDLFGK